MNFQYLNSYQQIMSRCVKNLNLNPSVIGVFSDVYNDLCSNSAGYPTDADDEQVPMIRRVFMRVPSRPRDPVATCDRGIYVTVEWTEPRRRANITGYVIKYGCKVKQSDDEDTDVAKYDELYVKGDARNFQFTHQLNDETSYHFAVAAVNAAGRGEFSEFTDFVETLPGKFRYDHHVSPMQLNMLHCTCMSPHAFCHHE